MIGHVGVVAAAAGIAGASVEDFVLAGGGLRASLASNEATVTVIAPGRTRHGHFSRAVVYHALISPDLTRSHHCLEDNKAEDDGTI
jgi:hypothetical protein